ncbi:uncharacterized protein LOC114524853 [Dendronephthya gigantea]|uniref:uncharacterized protein LOC114524853 n=1 Tax=Dendronephthya gigantea TaxID=151771 RepID=UPI001069EC12|nr:uncharacterized protein LOC114524853 [Dendronephthya gigantea]
MLSFGPQLSSVNDYLYLSSTQHGVSMSDDLKDVKIILANQDGAYQPCVLSGILEICPSKPTTIHEIQVKLTGQAYISLANTERREVFIDIVQIIFPTPETQISEHFETTLQENVRYTVPFHFQLRNHLPSSFELNTSYSGITAYVRYYIESIVIRSKHTLAHRCRKDFKFRQTRELTEIPGYSMPKTYLQLRGCHIHNSICFRFRGDAFHYLKIIFGIMFKSTAKKLLRLQTKDGGCAFQQNE